MGIDGLGLSAAGEHGVVFVEIVVRAYARIDAVKVALTVAVDVTFDDGIGKQLDGRSVDAEIVEVGVERVLVRQRRAHGTQDVADVPRIAELFGRQPQGVGALR